MSSKIFGSEGPFGGWAPARIVIRQVQNPAKVLSLPGRTASTLTSLEWSDPIREPSFAHSVIACSETPLHKQVGSGHATLYAYLQLVLQPIPQPILPN